MHSNLRIAHISPTRGGVANAARRLHLGLLKLGLDSKLFLSEGQVQPETQTYTVPTPNPLLSPIDKASKVVSKRIGAPGMLNVSSLFWSFPDADVIHLHGAITEWFNLGALNRLSRGHALVWTMHDKHLGTGVCGYPENWDCEGWQTGCGHCPKVHESNWLLDLTRVMFRRKQAILNHVPMAVVAPSQWMFDFISVSPITRHQVLRRIPYGIDTDIFTPYPAAQVRRELGLPPHASLLLSVASKLGSRAKGCNITHRC